MTNWECYFESAEFQMNIRRLKLQSMYQIPKISSLDVNVDGKICITKMQSLLFISQIKEGPHIFEFKTLKFKFKMYRQMCE